MKRNPVFKATLTLRVFLLVALVTGQFGTTIHASATGNASKSSIPSADFTCTDLLGCISINPTDPLHIAYALNISGSLGIDSRNGVEIAIDDSGGKILGHDITFDGQDDGCSPNGGTAAGTVLAADATIVAVIGTSCSSAAITAMPLLAAAGMSMVSPSNSNPSLTDPLSPNHHAGYFRTAENDTVEGTTAADFAYNFLGLRKAATIQDGSLYSSSVAQSFAVAFEALGGTITSESTIDPGASDFSAVLGPIASDSPDLLYFPVFMSAGGYIITQARSTSGLESAFLMGSDGLNTPAVVSAAGADVEGFLVTGPDTSLYSPAYERTFLPAYHAKFGYDPTNVYHAQAYDAFNLIKAAIETVAVHDPDGTLHIGRQALRDALYATKDYPGLTGSLTCTPNGDCAALDVAVFRYHAGQDQPVKVWSACTDPSICYVTISPSDKVHIAYALDTTDSLGTDSYNGAEIAKADSGEILGHDITFDGHNEECSSSGGASAGTALAADHTIVAVIGTSCSGAARTAMPLLYAVGMSMVSPSNTAPDLTDPNSPNHYPGYFRTAWNDNVQGKTAADFANNFLGVWKAATIDDGSLYSNSLAQVFADDFEALGGTITSQSTVDPNATDFTSELTAIASHSPQLVYFPIFLPAGGYMISQARGTTGLENAYLMGADGLYSSDILTSAAGSALEGFLVTGPDDSQYSPAYESTFLPEYRSTFGYDPTNVFHAQAYDAFMLIKAAIEAVAVEDLSGNLHISRLALEDALYATKDYPGLTGSLTCSPYGDCGAADIAVFRYQAGQYPPVRFWWGVTLRTFLPLIKR